MHMRTVAVVGCLFLLTAAVGAAGIDLKPIVDPYLRIQQALTVDRLDGISNDAQSIATAASKLGSDGGSIEAAASELLQASDLKSARAAFGALSDAIVTVAKTSGQGYGKDVRLAYCPMVRKHWLQKGDKVQNPFFGAKMSDCGRFDTN